MTDYEKIIENFLADFKRKNPDSEVEFIAAKREKKYIKVWISRNKNEDWYHVFENGVWY